MILIVLRLFLPVEAIGAGGISKAPGAVEAIGAGGISKAPGAIEGIVPAPPIQPVANPTNFCIKNNSIIWAII